MSREKLMEFNTEKEYEYVLNHGDKLDKYAGQWIAVLGEKVICSDKDLSKVWESFKKSHPDTVPFFMKVVDQPLLLL